MKPWLFLAVGIVAETFATSAMKACDGFTRLWPSLIVIVGYATAFACVSVAVRSIPVGIAYAIWSGVGITLIALIAWWLYGQKLDAIAVAGISLIAVGIMVLSFSKTAVH